MRKMIFGLLLSGLVGTSGCTQGTPGGPGVQSMPSTTQSQTTYKPVVSDSRDTFSLKLPMISTSIKQGETKSASISIQRGSNFEEDVSLSFSNLPSGVTFEPANPVLKASDKEQKINIMVADDAALGDFTVNVKGHPNKSGADATNELKLTISAK